MNGTIRMRIAGQWHTYPVRRCDVDGAIEVFRPIQGHWEWWSRLTPAQQARVDWSV